VGFECVDFLCKNLIGFFYRFGGFYGCWKCWFFKFKLYFNSAFLKNPAKILSRSEMLYITLKSEICYIHLDMFCFEYDKNLSEFPSRKTYVFCSCASKRDFTESPERFIHLFHTQISDHNSHFSRKIST
jgi:YHS domain-containing protein